MTPFRNHMLSTKSILQVFLFLFFIQSNFTTDAQTTNLSSEGQTSLQPFAQVVDKDDAATFVSDVTIADGTVMKPGQSFTKTWRISNSGSTTWKGYSLNFLS